MAKFETIDGKTIELPEIAFPSAEIIWESSDAERDAPTARRLLDAGKSGSKTTVPGRAGLWLITEVGTHGDDQIFFAKGVPVEG